MSEQAISIAGAVTYWTLAEWTNVEKIHDSLVDLGLDKFVPSPPTPAVALRRALVDVFRKRNKLVRPLKHGRFAVVDETRKGDDLDYAVELRAEANNGDVLDFQPADHPAEAAVADAYARLRLRAPALAVSSSLSSIASHLRGVRLRDTGGVYWIPEAGLETWRKVATAFEEASSSGRTMVYRLRTAVDDAAVTAVAAAIEKEVEDAVDEIKGKIRDQVRPTALKRRVEETEALQDKIDRYEKILGRSLQHLRDKAKETEGEANLAALAALGGQ
jgi:hypothetical protein